MPTDSVESVYILVFDNGSNWIEDLVHCVVGIALTKEAAMEMANEHFWKVFDPDNRSHAWFSVVVEEWRGWKCVNDHLYTKTKGFGIWWPPEEAPDDYPALPENR